MGQSTGKNAKTRPPSGQRRARVWVIWALVAGGAGWGLYAMLAGGGYGAADADNPARVAAGAPLYAQYCAACHGASLQGQPNWRERNADGTLPAPPHDADGHTWHHPDGVLFGIIKQGGQAGAPAGFKSAMPGFGESLSDDDIWSILAFIKSRWPETVRARQEGITQRSR